MSLNTMLSESTKRVRDTDTLNTVLKHTARLLDGVEQVGADEDRILKNRTLSDEGKRQALAARATEHLGNLNWLLRLLTDVEAAITRVHSLNYAFLELPRESEIMQLKRELRAKEIRAAHHEGNRDALFLSALDQDNLEVAQAFLTAPGGSWVSPPIKQRGADAYAQRATPEAFRRQQSLLVLQEHLEGLAEQARRWLITLGANQEDVAKKLPPKTTGINQEDRLAIKENSDVINI
jgi:hypothetical protein